MAILEILTYPDERLRKRAEPVEKMDGDLQRLVDDMAETMYAEPGIGLAATQVGVLKRLLVIDVEYTDGKPNLRRFHQAKWDEPIIFELSCEGQRGIYVPEVEDEVRDQVGDVLMTLPETMRRKRQPRLPEPSRRPATGERRPAWANWPVDR